MFEQSLLLHSTSGRKAGAFATSLTMQTAAAGALLLVPLIYTDRLPFVQATLPTFLPPAPPPVPKMESVPPSHPPATTVRIFAAPRTVPPLNTQPEIHIDGPAPDFSIHSVDPAAAIPPTLNLTRVLPPPPPPPEPNVAESAPAKPIAVTSEVQAAKLIRKVVPTYPRLAIVARVSGTVHLIATIGTDGTVRQLQVASGPSLLVQAALEAVRQWVYRPTLLHAKPVEVIAPIDVIFTFTQ
jgi:protein TonB